MNIQPNEGFDHKDIEFIFKKLVIGKMCYEVNE